MADVEITVNGVDRLVTKLGRLDSLRPLVPVMRRTVLRLQRDLQEYPPPRPGSRYVRGQGMADANGVVRHMTSEKLGQRWTTKVSVSSTELVGTTGNNASYGPLVQSRQFQARVHRGRWPTDASVMNRNAPAIVRDFEQATADALR